MQTLTDLSLRMTLFYVFILAGYLVARYVESADRVNRGVTSILINILLPILILQTFLGASPLALLELPIVIALTILIHALGFILMFARQQARSTENRTKGAELLCATFNNGIFLPLPLILMFIGDVGVPILALYSITQMPLLAIGGGFIGSAYSETKISLKSSARKAVLFPPFLAATTGIILLLAGFGIPQAVFWLLSYNSTLTTYLSLLAVGLGMGTSFVLTNFRNVIETIMIRQAIVPLVVLIVLSLITLSSVTKSVMLLQALMPPAVLTVIYATNFDLDSERAASTVTLGTILLLPVVPLLPFILP